MHTTSKGGLIRVVIAFNVEGMPLKETVKETLFVDGHEVVDLSEILAVDFMDSACAVAADLLEREEPQGLRFDACGVGGYLAATRVKGMVAANISNERSAYMACEHNNSRMVVWAQLSSGPKSPRRSPASSWRHTTLPAVIRTAPPSGNTRRLSAN